MPRQRLEAPLNAGKLRDAWTVTTAPSEVVGMGRFRLKEFSPAKRWIWNAILTIGGLGCRTSMACRVRALDLLILPILVGIEVYTHLIGAPHGELHGLPFAALYDGVRCSLIDSRLLWC